MNSQTKNLSNQHDILQNNIPEDFSKIICDFVYDFLNTFPEYKNIISNWWILENKQDNHTNYENIHSFSRLCRNTSKNIEINKQNIPFIFRHCLSVFPERFFDILYKNENIFLLEENINTEFLPGIIFKFIWNNNISENTKQCLWNYLQLILFSVITSIKQTEQFGITAKLFEGIDENELKIKLQDTIQQIQNIFDIQPSTLQPEPAQSCEEPTTHEQQNKTTEQNIQELQNNSHPLRQKEEHRLKQSEKNDFTKPNTEHSEGNAEEHNTHSDTEQQNTSFHKTHKTNQTNHTFHDKTPEPTFDAEFITKHIQELMGGKLGQVAYELAEETAKELDLDEEELKNINTSSIFQKLFKNPGKLIDMIKNIGNKIDNKLKSGELKESELLSESVEFLEKIKNTPGMGNIQELFKSMGLNSKQKININSMQSKLNSNIQKAKLKERMQKKISKKNNPSQQNINNSQQNKNYNNQTIYSDEELYKLFGLPPLPSKNKK